jgi:hypothetical protein
MSGTNRGKELQPVRKAVISMQILKMIHLKRVEKIAI